MSDKAAYATGWVIQVTPNGNIVWHNGGTTSFGAYVGLQLDKEIGVVVLTNEANVGFPDAVGEWVLDRLLGNPEVDHVGERLKLAKASAEKDARLWVRPANPRPSPPPVRPASRQLHPSGGGQGHRQTGGRRTCDGTRDGRAETQSVGRGDLYRHACAEWPACGRGGESRSATAFLRAVPIGRDRRTQRASPHDKRRPNLRVQAGVGGKTRSCGLTHDRHGNRCRVGTF